MGQTVTVKLALRKHFNGAFEGEPVSQEAQATLISVDEANGVAIVQIGTTRLPVKVQDIVSERTAPEVRGMPLRAAQMVARFTPNPVFAAAARAQAEQQDQGNDPE